jgi:DNA-binding NtrC family response regulator
MDAPVPLVAHRYVGLTDGTHLDLATGEPVCLTRTSVPAHARAMLADEGARLCRLWHRDLAPYVDCGPLGETEWFEATARLPPRALSLAQSRRAEIVAFLRAHGLTSVRLVDTGLDTLAPSLLHEGEPVSLLEHEPVSAGFGLRLANAPLVSTVLCWLEERLDPGPHVWSIDAPHGSGWRTCWMMLAREVRRFGYVPVDAGLLTRAVRAPGPQPRSWLGCLRDRALLVAHHTNEWTDGERRRLAALVMVLGGLQTGVPVLLDVVRQGRPHAPRLRLEPLNASALAASVWSARRLPGTRRLRSFAIAAGGRPGPFVEAIGRSLAAPGDPSFSVHERPPARTIYARPLQAAAVDEVLGRVGEFEARGRHAAAERWLRREGAKLNRRGHEHASLSVWAALAVQEARRGHVSQSARTWARAWDHGASRDDLDPVFASAPQIAEAWIRNASLVRAEQLLSAVIQAAAACTGRVPDTVPVLLSEVLYWQNRAPEARAVLEGCRHPSAFALLARTALALGDVASALQEAVQALERARAAQSDESVALALAARLRIDAVIEDDQRAETTAEALRALTIQSDTIAADESVLCIAEGWTFRRRPWPKDIRAGVVALAAHNRPRLTRARARLVLALNDPRHHRDALIAEVQRAALATGAKALLPGPVSHPPWPPSSRNRSTPMVHDIVSILQACQQDDEPPEVVRRVVSMVRERTASSGVTVFSAEDCGLVSRAKTGRAPGARLGERAVTLRGVVGPEETSGSWEAAWPILHRETVAGAMVCQWTSLAGGPPLNVVSIAATAAAALGPVVQLLRAPALPVGRPTGPATELLGSSEGVVRVRQAIDRAASAPFAVLIEGESGAGKELVARAIHERSPRRARAFCAINCAALTDELFEAELFGHARGAFTGAIADRPGLFEDADGGTLFLDEVIELSARAQAKLLRALQEGEIRRVGETRSRRVDVRVIAATNRSLAAGVTAGQFRADLRFRLDVLRIDVPALRARPEDIGELALHFWARAAERVGSRAMLGPGTLAALARYDWPGNVRELQNVLAAMAVGAPRQGIVRASSLPSAIRVADSGVVPTLEEARRRFEAGFVRAAMARAGGSRSRAAADLGVSRQGLAKLLERLGLSTRGQELSVRSPEPARLECPPK